MSRQYRVVFVKVLVVLQEYIDAFQELFVEFADMGHRSSFRRGGIIFSQYCFHSADRQRFYHC